MRTIYLIILTTIFVAACTSPLDLDVDRDKVYASDAAHPKRLSMYYHFADSAYEAIVTDTSFLNTIWIERDTDPVRITIPQLIFELPQSIEPTFQHSPFVSTLCFSTIEQPADGVYRMCINENSWISGSYLDEFGIIVPFNWSADDRARQIRLAYYHLPEERLVKGSIQIAIVDPSGTRYVTYRALITMEY